MKFKISASNLAKPKPNDTTKTAPEKPSETNNNHSTTEDTTGDPTDSLMPSTSNNDVTEKSSEQSSSHSNTDGTHGENQAHAPRSTTTLKTARTPAAAPVAAPTAAAASLDSDEEFAEIIKRSDANSERIKRHLAESKRGLGISPSPHLRRPEEPSSYAVMALLPSSGVVR